jgi:hypothetical protein
MQLRRDSQYGCMKRGEKLILSGSGYDMCRVAQKGLDTSIVKTVGRKEIPPEAH